MRTGAGGGRRAALRGQGCRETRAVPAGPPRATTPLLAHPGAPAGAHLLVGPPLVPARTSVHTRDPSPQCL